MKIAILSRNPRLYSTRRIVEAGVERGHEMIVIDHTKCFMTIEKKKPLVHTKGQTISDISAVIPRIGSSVTFYGSAVVRQFEMGGVFTTTRSVALTRSRDKLRSLQILSREGLGIPKTAFAKHPDDIKDLIKSVGGAPLIIKLLEGTQGLGVVLAETSKAAKSVIEAFYDMDANILVQEFIEEANGADIRVLVVDGEVVGAMKRQGVEGEFRSNLHRGGTATIIKLSKKQKSAALGAANAMGLKVCGVDMLESEKGPLILEVNSSPGLEGIETATKVDIAGKIISYVERNAGKRTKRKDSVGA